MHVDELRHKIVNTLRSKFPDDSSDYHIESTVFTRPNNIRLSYKGNLLFAKVCKNYVFPHNDQLLTKHIIALSRMLKFPYYLSSNYLILYAEEDAIMVSLHGDVKAFLESL